MKRGFIQSPFLTDLQNEAYRLVKTARERWKTAQEDGVTELSAFKNIREKIKKITGGRKGFYYAPIVRLAENDLKLLVKQYKTFLANPQTTSEGRKEIMKKAREAFQSNTNYTDNEYLAMWDVFSTDSYHMLLEAGLMDSDDVITAVLDSDNKKSVQEIASAIEKKLYEHVKSGKKWNPDKTYKKKKKRKRKRK